MIDGLSREAKAEEEQEREGAPRSNRCTGRLDKKRHYALSGLQQRVLREHKARARVRGVRGLLLGVDAGHCGEC